jgi:hypothetical protein
MANKKRKVTQATRNKLRRASKLYQKVRKNTQKELERRGQPLKGKELTSFVRDKVYGEFKGLSPNEVRIADINDAVERAVTGTGILQTGEFFNPLAIPETLISGIFWFDIDNFIEVDLTAETGGKNLRLEVNAGEYGSTGIIELSEYTYEGSGLAEIIEQVREFVEDDSEPYWEGEARVRPRLKDDGNPDSYFLQFTLYVNGTQVAPSATFEEPAPIGKIEETIEERRKKRREIVKRRKELAKQKREKAKKKEAKMRKRPTKKEPAKAEAPERAKNVQEALDRQERLLKDSKDLFDAGILTKKEFIAERKAIIEQTNKAIEKFKRGGEIN